MWEPQFTKPDIPPPDPQKPYVLNELDRRMLRAMRIGQDQPPVITPDEDDGA